MNAKTLSWIAAALIVTAARGAVVFDSRPTTGSQGVLGDVVYDPGPGMGAPTGMLGGYTMTPFPLDDQPLFASVLSVASPLGGELGFSIPLSHRRIGSGWATWSHDYTGDAYYTNGASSITLTLPPDTGAIEFYVEPNAGLELFEVIADDGTSSGFFDAYSTSMATYVGFYTTDGSALTSLEVNCTSDFAIGEFAIALVPESAGLPLLVLAGLVAVRRR